MADLKASYGGVNELDELQQRFAGQNLADDDDTRDNSANEEEPRASGSSPETRDRPTLTEDGKRVMLVAAKSRVKQVAGSIARTTRENPDDAPPVLSAVGAASVNQAVKAIAIARDFLEGDGCDLAVEVNKKPQQQVKDVIVFTLSKHPRGVLLGSGDKNNPDESEDSLKSVDGIEYQDMRSASSSTPAALAGAIAKNVRESKRPRITAIGQRPVFKAVCAVVLARRYLKKDNLDLDIVPRFTHVHFENGSDANAMQLILIARKI